MLKIDTLSVNKRIFNPDSSKQSDSFGIWDLTESSIDYTSNSLSIRKVYTVPEDLSMRPDLVSLYQTGDTQYCGSIMKINGISNPFAIDSGQYLLILTPENIIRTYDRKKQLNSVQSVSDKNSPLDALKKSQEDKKFKVSEGRKNFLDKNIKNKPPLVLPPNVMQPGDRKFDRKGKVFTFAPDAGKGGFNRPLNK
jgi:hypothetical protein